MKDKEKQIEEMADILCESKEHNCNGEDCKCLKQATDLFNKGVRILPKDSVVLSKEEKDKTDKYITDLCSMIDNLRDDLKKAHKETVEKIIVDLIARAKQKQEEYKDMSYKSIGYNPNIGKSISAEWYLFEKYLRNILAKQFGVEIKE